MKLGEQKVKKISSIVAYIGIVGYCIVTYLGKLSDWLKNDPSDEDAAIQI